MGRFIRSTGVAVDSYGDIYVADWGNQRVQKFTADGTLLTAWGSDGYGTGPFGSPFGIAVGASGDITVVDRLFSSIFVFEP